MRKLEGKSAIVTGASTRIGAAVSLALALDGAAVVAGYPRNQSSSPAIRKEFANGQRS